MTDVEVALKLLELARKLDPGLVRDKDSLLALFRECLAAVRGQAE